MVLIVLLVSIARYIYNPVQIINYLPVAYANPYVGIADCRAVS